MGGRLPTLIPRDDRERQVIEVWQASAIRLSTIAVYLTWIRRFRRHCRDEGQDEVVRLTLSAVVEWSKSYVGPRRGRRVKNSSRLVARNALHAWSCALQLLGVSVPTWSAAPTPARLPPLLAGGKERSCPLWAETVAALRSMVIDATQPDEPVFRNARGAPLTRDGVAYVITKHVRRAAEGRPALRRRRVTPHVLRHSCAVALLQAGVDVSVIRDYLGHASITTTSRYIATNLEMKRVVLEAFWARAGLDRRSAAGWRPSPKLLAYLASL